MANKLKSLLTAPKLKLVLRAGLFGGSLAFFRFNGFLISSYFFLIVIFLAFAWPRIKQRRLNVSFLFLWITGFLLSRYLLADWTFAVALFFLVFFAFLELGINDLVFENLPVLYQFLNTAMFFTLFTMFFSADLSSYFSVKYLAAALVIFLFFRETFQVLLPAYRRKRALLMVSVLTLITVELLWAIKLLPIGFVNSAALATLAAFLLRDAAGSFIQGNLSRTFILKRATLLIVLLVFILGASQWTI